MPGRPKGSGPTPGSFQPGHQGGRKENLPRGRFITQHLISHLMEEIEDPEFKADPKNPRLMRERAKRVHFFVKKLVSLALAGDTTCLKMVMDRVEGHPAMTMAFVPAQSDDEVAAENAKLVHTRQSLEKMTEDERTALYVSTLQDLNRSRGSSAPN